MNSSINYKGYTIEIKQDGYPENPRTEWDNLGVMVCFHKRYNLGDLDHQINQNEWFNNDTEEYEAVDSWEDVKNQIIAKYGDLAVILPLSLYDHSGITMKVGQPTDYWDSGLVGFIFITNEKVIKEYGDLSTETIEKAKSNLVNEVDIYDQYLTGDVWGYIVHDPEGKEIDSLWGFYGHEAAVEASKETVDYEVRQREAKKQKKLKAYIKNHIPIQYRFV